MTAELKSRTRYMFEKYRRYVLASLRVIGVANSELEDAMQEVFCVVVQRMGDYEERGQARAWLYSICVRVEQTRRRALRRRLEDLVPELPEVPFDPTQLEHMVEREKLRLGHALLAALSIEQRQVFFLYDVEGRSMPDIALMLGCPLQTAYSRLRAARRRILRLVELSKYERRTSPQALCD